MVQKESVKSVGEIRHAVEKKQAELQRVATLPPTREEALERVRIALDAEGARVPLNAGLALSPSGSRFKLGAALMAPHHPSVREDVHLARVLCLLCRDRLFEIYVAEIDRFLDGKETIAAGERAERIASLQSEIRKLEEKEESLILEAEAAGLELLRRGDADPAVFLEWKEDAA